MPTDQKPACTGGTIFYLRRKPNYHYPSHMAKKAKSVKGKAAPKAKGPAKAAKVPAKKAVTKKGASAKKAGKPKPVAKSKGPAKAKSPVKYKALAKAAGKPKQAKTVGKAVKKMTVAPVRKVVPKKAAAKPKKAVTPPAKTKKHTAVAKTIPVAKTAKPVVAAKVGKVTKPVAPVTKPKGQAPAGKNPVAPSEASTVSNAPVRQPKTNQPPKRIGKMVRVDMEFYMQSSPATLYELISTPSGFAEWYCQDVDVKNELYTFIWDGEQEETTVIGRKAGEMIRFHRNEDDESDTFFEFRVRVDAMTNEVALEVIDYAVPDEVEETRNLWSS